MNNTVKSVMPAIGSDQDSLRILRDVSHIYEMAKGARKALAKVARDNGHTFQELGDAMGTDRSSAHTLINGRAA